MKLKKSLLDIPAADGLAQKIDARRLPMGKSAAAINLVKNKQGRLEKRLGYSPLTTASIEATATVWAQGIAMGSWQTRPLGIGQGVWAPTGQTIVDLKTYSDDVGKWKGRGFVPEMPVVEDEIIADAPTSAFNITSIVSGDYKMLAWTGTDASGNTFVWYCVRELSTGLYVQPPQIAQPNGSPNASIACMRLALVGTKAVLVYGQSTNVFGMALDVSVWATTTFSTLSENNFITNNSAGLFDMVAVGGDNSNFLIGYEVAPGGTRSVVLDAWSAAFVLQTHKVVQAVAALSGSASGPYALRADTTTGVAFGYGITASPNSLYATVLSYPALNITGTTAQIYAGTGSENLPAAFAIGLCPFPASTVWMMAWSPGGSSFNYNASINGNFASAAQPFNNARINTQQFLVITGATIAVFLKPRFTPGLHLVSRLLELNGTLYCMGWIPSGTQGGYIVIAMDWAGNITDATSLDDGGNWTNPWDGRPIAHIQTRTALAPFLEVVWANSPFNSTSINTQTGLANWNLEGDVYGTVGTSCLGTAQGARTMPVSVRLQSKPRKGYQMAQFGTLTAIGGGIPTVFDGTNVFEQNYLYTPEQIGWTFANGVGPQWTSAAGKVQYIITYEQFDAGGNFHISGRSPAIFITGADVSWSSGTLTQTITLNIPTYGPTMRQYAWPMTLNPTKFVPPPSAPVQIGIWRTQEDGQVFCRVADRFYNGSDLTFPGITNQLNTTVVQYVDTCTEAQLIDGTHPDLYGDGSNGQPGNLDDLCPSASSIMVRHKERLFVARDNLLMYTKARSELVGPGYNEQLEAVFVGGDDPIVAVESMDDKLVVFKAQQCFYVGGDGPGDDGSGNSFTPPQPVPTDSGCTDYRGVRATPEGVYFQSQAGYRLFTRGLSIEYVGGPVEDELAALPIVTGALLYPSNNKLILLAAVNDTDAHLNGELINRDYVLDAWTTGVVNDNTNFHGPISGAIATAKQSGGLNEVVYLLMADGSVWRENDPLSATPYMDNGIFVNSIWRTPDIRQGDQGRFRVWDLWAWMQAMDPAGLQISIAIDYGTMGNTRTWIWNGAVNNLLPLVGSNGTLRVNTYDGRMVEAFQLQIVDVVDAATITGQGMQFLGFTASVGQLPGPFKGPPGATQ